MSQSRRTTFERIARRMGILNDEQLHRARSALGRRGGSIEAVLLEQGIISPELARYVQDAVRLARAG
jgi:transposase-like protein